MLVDEGSGSTGYEKGREWGWLRRKWKSPEMELIVGKWRGSLGVQGDVTVPMVRWQLLRVPGHRKVKVARSYPTLCNPMDYTVHGILQARLLEWVAFLFSRGSSQPRSPALQAHSLPAGPQEKPKNTGVGSLSLLQWIFLTQESNWGPLHCRQILY